MKLDPVEYVSSDHVTHSNYKSYTCKGLVLSFSMEAIDK